jgi:hypothetical protein
MSKPELNFTNVYLTKQADLVELFRRLNRFDLISRALFTLRPLTALSGICAPSGTAV